MRQLTALFILGCLAGVALAQFDGRGKDLEAVQAARLASKALQLESRVQTLEEQLEGSQAALEALTEGTDVSRNFVIYYSTNGCTWCVRWERNVMPTLIGRGWTVYKVTNPTQTRVRAYPSFRFRDKSGQWHPMATGYQPVEYFDRLQPENDDE